MQWTQRNRRMHQLGCWLGLTLWHWSDHLPARDAHEANEARIWRLSKHKRHRAALFHRFNLCEPFILFVWTLLDCKISILIDYDWLQHTTTCHNLFTTWGKELVQNWHTPYCNPVIGTFQTMRHVLICSFTIRWGAATDWRNQLKSFLSVGYAHRFPWAIWSLMSLGWTATLWTGKLFHRQKRLVGLTATWLSQPRLLISTDIYW